MKKKILSFGLLVCGLLFFCNPNINIFDILPDAIGCLLIMAAISKISDLSDNFADAKHAFGVLFWITLSKLPALILLFWITGININEHTMRLVFAFCYAVAEVVFSIKAFNELFDALAYVGSRNEGGEFIFSMLKKRAVTKKNGKVVPAKYKRVEGYIGTTIAFFIAKAACYTVPELVYIAPEDDINPIGITLVHYRPLLIFAFAIIALILGIIWFLKLRKYFVHLKKHDYFWMHLEEQYEQNVLTKTSIFVLRRTSIFAALFTAAAIFSVDMYIDEINCIPDFVSAALFFASAFVIEKYAGSTKWLKLSSALYFVTSVFTYVSMLIFNSEYVYSSVHKIQRAKELYTTYAGANALSQVFFVFTMFAAASVMMKLVYAHTGINTLTGASSSAKPLHKVYFGRLARMRFFSVLSGIMSVLYFYFVVDVARLPLREGGYIYLPKFEVVWMVDFIVALIYAVHAANLAGDLLSEVKYKYKYE